MTYRLIIGVMLVWALPSGVSAQDANGRLKVYLDCNSCFGDFIREEVDIVEYVCDPASADVHIIVWSSDTGSSGRERAVALIGLGRFKGMDFKSRSVSQSGDTEDTQRQRLATAITIGLLNYLSSEGIEGGLTVEVEQTAQPGQTGPATDPWNFWVLSLQGSVAMDGEESSRQLDLSGELGADRITDEWKITMGLEDLNTGAKTSTSTKTNRCVRRRNERDFEGLVARSLNHHWSVGGRARKHRLVDVRQHLTFDRFSARRSNTTCSRIPIYTRRQLRFGYALGPYDARYREETLFFKTSEKMAQQQASITLDQREPWGSLQAEVEYSDVPSRRVALPHSARG